MNAVRETSIFTQYKQEVAKIQTACYEQLVNYELEVVNFYLKNENLAVTQKRLDYVRKELLAKAGSYAPKILQYEIAVAERKNDAELKKKKKQEATKTEKMN